ncbi:MAG: MBL fold metallo-hydrolase [Proteobacteria bacterium]|nr:MBL fold metallo-hydrolase [Pseudomonadota bacterium]
MKVRILGCGTSTGVPVIGCTCSTCLSTHPGNKRTRSSIALELSEKTILIDTSTDLRAQALKSKLTQVNAVLYTHYHADHLHGIDDLRSYNRIQDEETIPCYGDKSTIDRIRHSFEYIFATSGSKNKGGWKPNLSTSVIDGPFTLFNKEIIPIKIEHGPGTILGYRVDDFAYLTDCSGIPQESLELLKGTKVVIIGALRQRPHPSHFSIDQAIEASKKIGAERTILTHLGHAVDYEKVSPTLPAGVELAMDSMLVEL